jgi:cytochrome P450
VSKALYSMCPLNNWNLEGADTTSSSLAGCFFYLAKNPSIADMLAKELRNRFDSVEDVVPGAKLSSCQLLQAVIMESMRMVPAGSQLRREVIHPGGVTLSDGITHFTKGTDLIYPNFCALRDPVNYPDPHTWNPLRWIVKDEEPNEKEVAHMKKAFGNFSFGTRRCLGINLAYTEMYAVIARIVWQYEFECADGLGEKLGVPDEYDVRHHIVLVPKGPNLRFRKRGL